MRRPNLLDWYAEVSSALFESAHRANGPLAQITRVRLVERVAQPGEQLQQWRRGGDERAQARRGLFGVVSDRSDRVWCPRRRRFAGTGCGPPAAGNRPDDGPLCPFGLGKGVITHTRPWCCALAADRPKLHAQIGEIPRYEDREAARGLHLLPVRAVAVELEVAGARVERDLSRGYRQYVHRNPGEQNIDEVADMLDRADFHLAREQALELIGWHIGLYHQHKSRCTQDRAIDDQTDAHTMTPFLQRDRNGVRLDYRRQRAPQVGNHRGKAALQIVVPVRGIGVWPPRRLGECGQLAGHLNKGGIEVLGVNVAGIGPVGEQLLPTVDRLQQQKVGDLANAARARGGEPRRQRLATLVEHPGELGDQAGQRQRRGAYESRWDPARVEGGAPVRRNLGDTGKTDAEIAGALLRFQHVAQPQTGDLQRRRLRRGGMRVVGFEFAQRVAALAAVQSDLDGAGLADRG